MKVWKGQKVNLLLTVIEICKVSPTTIGKFLHWNKGKKSALNFVVRISYFKRTMTTLDYTDQRFMGT